MTDQFVSYHVHDGLATIQLTRESAMNALVIPMKEQLKQAVQSAAADDTVRAVVLTGSGRAFCVGQDLNEHIELYETDAKALMNTVPDHYNPIATELATMKKPVVAAINGVAAGAGMSLAMACDIRIATRSSRYNAAFSAIGLSADTGATYWLPRLVGVTKAMDWLMFPRTVNADEAFEAGLLTEVVDDDAFDSRVTEVATQLANGPTVAYAAIKSAVHTSLATSLQESLAFEGEMMQLTGGTEDHGNAVRAFLAKESPNFNGR